MGPSRQDTTPDTSGKPNRKRNHNIMWIVWLVLVVALGATGVWYYMDYQHRSAAQAEEERQQNLRYQRRLEELELTRQERERGEESVEVPAQRQQQVAPQHLQSFVMRNGDFVGYLSIPALNLSYPVMQADDNEYYLNRDMYGNYSSYGTIFLDAGVDLSTRAAHIVLYGHNMLDGQMFGTLTRLARPEIFDTSPQVVFDTVYGVLDFRIFSTHTIDYTDVEYVRTRFSVQQFQGFINRINSVSVPPVTAPATIENRILSLVTCNDYNFETTRFVAHGVLHAAYTRP